MQIVRLALGRADWSKFGVYIAVSLVAHMVFIFLAMPTSHSDAQNDATFIAERYAEAINRAVPLDGSQIAELEDLLASVSNGKWETRTFGETVESLAARMDVEVDKAEVIRAMDANHSRQGRMDIFIQLPWDEDRDASDLQILSFLVGEGTLKSKFGTHRLWVRLEGPDGVGRVAIETMDTRLYRNGRRTASDLLYGAVWVGE